MIQALLDIGSLWLAIVAVAALGGRRVLLPARREADVLRRADGRGSAAGSAARAMRLVLALNGLAVLALGLVPGRAARALRRG